MHILYNFENIDKHKKTAVTIGTYDGVHLGHKMVLNKLVGLSKQEGLISTVITFSPHPRIVLNKGPQEINLIDTEEEKYKKFEKLGVDVLIVVRFDEAFSKLSYKVFVENYLMEKLQISYFVFGKDHRFGHERKGNMQTLNELSDQHGFKIEYVNTYIENGIDISSTQIRKALETGDVAIANRMMGDVFEINAKVVEGHKIGSRIGFPTANLETNTGHKIIPAQGVYAVKVEYENKLFNAMLNIGKRPTFGNSESTSIEVHIFDFNESLYGKNIRVLFIERLRDEKKFSTIEALKLQLKKDKTESQKILQHYLM